MATDRRKQAVLAIVLVVLGFVLYRAVTSVGTTSGDAASPSNPGGRTARAGSTAPPDTAPDVHLKELEADRPKPSANERNLFRFKPKAPPPLPPSRNTPAEVRSGPIVPPGPPPPAPIPLKFIGIVETPTRAKRIAALVDPTGHSYHGGEGEIVAGQYRILKIGVESIELAYLDGRGRQTIRLAGS
jgi:hypothetical protein